jgi:hypothetical protein
MLYTWIEVTTTIFLILAIADAVRHYAQNRKKMLLLVLAFAYAAIFENVNMILAKGNSVSYFYNPSFAMYLWHAPLAIIMLWTVMIYTSMHLSDMLKLKTLVRPFADVLLILVMVMSLGVVAVRQTIWVWEAFAHNSGWFGVPADYLIVWVFLVLMFSFLFRYFTRADDDMVNKTTRTEYYFLLPTFAYLGMLVVFSMVNVAEELLGLTEQQELFVLFGLVIIIAAAIRSPAQEGKRILDIDNFTIFTIILIRLAIYFYITWSVVIMEIFREVPEMIVILIISMAAEIMMHHSAFGDLGGNVELVHDDDVKEMKHY